MFLCVKFVHLKENDFFCSSGYVVNSYILFPQEHNFNPCTFNFELTKSGMWFFNVFHVCRNSVRKVLFRSSKVLLIAIKNFYLQIFIPVRMEPSCSRSDCDIYEETNNVPFDRAENKTDDASVVDKEEDIQDNIRQPIDDLERDDFDEENRILNHCSGMIVDGKLAATAHYSGTLSSANSSLASSSETISTLNIINDFSMPGCSKQEDCDDSNTTIKNMIRNRKYLKEASRKERVYKPDFMQKLLSSGTQEKKDFPKGKLYKGDKMGESSCDNFMSENCDLDAATVPSGRTSSNASSIVSNSSDSTKDFSVPSTSNAEKLLGLDDSSKRNEPTSSKSMV